jgi:hypothetical protein
MLQHLRHDDERDVPFSASRRERRGESEVSDFGGWMHMTISD